MKTEQTKLENGDLQITLTFDSHDQKCLEHDLIDIVDWYEKGPSENKIHSCRKRMILENRDLLMKSKDMQSKTVAEANLIMNDDVEIVKAITSMSTYKNRVQREEEDARI